MRANQRRTFNKYSAMFDPNVVNQWEAMVRTWEEDTSSPDPYEEPAASISYATTKKQLNEEEAIEARQGVFPSHDVTPGVFLQLGLEIEDQQRALTVRAASGTSISELAGQQEKRNVLMRRIDSWQAMQDVHMPVATPLRASPSDPSSTTQLPTGTVPKAEHIKLWLPSMLPAPLLAIDSLKGLRQKEARLRHAQLSDSLDDIRRMRRVLAAIADYNKTNVAGSGQRATTRMQELYARFRAKERRAVNRYRAARAAMQVLQPDGDWTSIYRPLLDDDLRGPRKQDDDLDGVFASEGRYQISWIWLTPNANKNPSDDEATRPATADKFSASMRTEWARSRARAHRWEEEEQLLLEEMRRVIVFFAWRASWWREQAGCREGLSERLGRGLAIYARRQATCFEGLATRCGARWYSYLKTRGAVPEWLQRYAAVAVPYHPRRSLAKMLREYALHDAAPGDADSSACDDDHDDDGYTSGLD
ncbi:uncharacterized protein TRAVEDRAFT_54297 [Trametes versicolor FP-101664 SS1]|uniref:Uncharacterized protein n=1 Tax=Trametes versicolor (strain FP-101664) TaxID=717944 RepID=R7S878_TRAVS|nr:uncharacterized protein TRAVEDRAFT_54297 [Trametes versicolor FP-101664 SS1]EIW51877.1 hypothetical protein TRAVEDRAFT_54297 [Trametes versicolor FP-101664 SS1]